MKRPTLKQLKQIRDASGSYLDRQRYAMDNGFKSLEILSRSWDALNRWIGDLEKEESK